MSGKPERAESPGGKILQKARSFKQDLKSRIRRTPSASRAEKEPSPSRKSHQQALRKKVGRTISFNEGSKTDADAKNTADALCLDQDGSRVFNAIKYLRDVVTKGVLEQLSGATNIVLESVAEILQSVNKYFINQESTLLTSLSNQVYLNLANLIKWADQCTLDKSMDTKSVHKYVDPLEKGIKELLHLSKEKLQCREINTSKTLQRPPGHRKTSSTERTSSVPEPVPLTPEEIKLLNQHTVLLSGASHSNGCYSNGDSLVDSAPPKPPLPQTFKLKSCPSIPPADEDDVFASDVTSPDDTPPPLPVKHKSRVNSSYDNTDGKDLQIPANSSQIVQVPESLPLVSPPQPEPSSGSSSSQDVTKLSPQDGTTAVTPRSQSPSSSVSSARSGSSVEYLLDRSATYTPHLDTSISEQRLSHYDNNCQPWSESVSNCDKSTTQGMLSQAITQQVTSKETTLKAAQRVKQSVATVHTSTYDSGIYDNKNFSCDYVEDKSTADQPPPLPDKKNKRPSVESSATSSLCAPGQRQRVPSMYDNVAEELASRTELATGQASKVLVTKTQTVSSTDASGQIQKQFVQNVERTQAAAAMRAKNTMNVVVGGHHVVTNSSTVSQTMQFMYMKETFSSEDNGQYDAPDGDPPPLPPKKRHVETYMQIFGHSPGLTDQELTRRSVRSMHFYHEQWQQHQMELFMPSYRRSNTFSVKPTQNQLRRELYSAVSSSVSDSQRASDVSSVISGSSSEDGNVLQGPVPTMPLPADITTEPALNLPELPAKQRSSDTSSSSGVSSRRSDPTLPLTALSDITEDNQLIKEAPSKISPISESKTPDESVTQPHNTLTTNKQTENNDNDSAYSEIMENNILDEVDVSNYLVRKKENEDGPDLRGGCIDALIVHATTTGKNDFMYQEAFLTTYRTMITSHDLVEKLIYRYNRFSRMNDIKKKKLSRNAFSLLTRVVNELCTEVDETLIEMLMALVFQMLCDGELTLARVLRAKILEKCHYLQKRREANQQAALWPQYKLSTRQYTMFHFKSQDIAEQMTLLDAELFQKIEIPEVLLWAKEQVEEHSPNLTKFTEHFNKMSYWCRTRILEQEDPKDREHCFVKFIKVMRYLEKFNNFNSYLAILSALSSSPLARLDWQKQNVDTLAQYFLLIDNTHGFRTYRQRLSETEPPCIPYIGLILQDLTFVHVGNKDWLSDNVVNFTKRWQQFNILDNMRRFRKCNYEFTKKEKIISFFNNFDNYLPEETLWQISEAIKPPKRTLYRSQR